MLVLTRKPHQSIMIGDDIEVTVLEVKGEQVRIGVAAPRQIPVHRKEIYLEIRQQSEAASARVETETVAQGDSSPAPEPSASPRPETA